jgi:mono/diheme cytochrome c family protein
MYVKEVGRAAPRRAALTLLAVAVFPSSTALSQTSARSPVVPASQAAATHAAPSPRALVDQYCVVCHNQKTLTAGVSLEGIDFSNPAANAAIMERVLRKVRTGEMPPAGMPRPPAPVLAAFTKSLEGALDQAAAAHPNPGRPAIHRLNRAEYSNAIRDILALDIQPGSSLPVDDSGYGFDNIGDVLSVSPALLEKYMSVARMISRLAVGDTGVKSSVEDFPARQDAPGAAGGDRNERVSDDLPFDSRGGFALRYYFPVDAEYVIRVKLNQGGGDDKTRWEVRQAVPAGLRTIGVTFLRESAKAEVVPGGRRGGAAAAAAAAAEGDGGTKPGGRGAAPMAELDLRLDGAKLKRFEVPEIGARPQVTGITLEGPYNATGPGNTPSRARIFVCHPATSKDEEPCARTILATVGRRAFRRPVTDADLKPLMAFYQSGRAERDFDFGIEKALRAMLVSPDFLFRIEQDPRGRQPSGAAPGAALKPDNDAGSSPGSVYRISDFELASRLSFFLWSTVPDDQLLDLAEKGKLKDPAVLNQQVRRLLDDPRSASLVANFAGQWLYIRNLAQQKPDPDAFPEFDESLRQAFRQETELFFQNILREDCSVLDLLDANYTFLNQRLAEHYGIPNIYGPQFRKVTLTDPNRGGLLGQGSILTVTSYPNRTSVVQRGKWILDNLLGSPPPPKPPDIPELEAHSKDGKPLTMREQMELHRSNAICASCHARMDPIGFALENFDGVGKWRDQDGGSAIDASGKLPGGVQFQGPAGLKKLLVASYGYQFETTVTEKLLTYALGRGLEYYDKPAVRSILRQAASDNYKMSALVTAIVKSTPFQMRRTPEQ